MTVPARPLAGRTALVTGASRGIGAAIARELGARGARVAITYLSSDAEAQQVVADIVASGSEAHAIRADHATREGSEQAVVDAHATLGSLDILVNNVGVGWIHPLEETPEDKLDAMLDVNLRGVIYSTRTAIPLISHGGRIINIGSIVGTSVPYAGCSVYAATKGAIMALSKSLSRDLGPRGITVNVVEPGPIATEGTPPVGEFAEMLIGFTSLGRFGSPQDVAGLVAWIASDEARMMTGAIVTLDGGWSA